MRAAIVGASVLLCVAACGHDQTSRVSDAGACVVSGCGGDIEGTWDVTAMCVQLTGQVVTGLAACDAASKKAFDSARVVPVRAQLVFADGSYTQSGTARAELQYTYTNECLLAQSGVTASVETCDEIETNLTNAGQTAACE